MSGVGFTHEDLASNFRQWARSNLTTSLKKSSTLRSLSSRCSEDMEELIKSLREIHLMEPFTSWTDQNKRWWNAATTGNLHEMVLLLKEEPNILHWKNPIDGWTAIHYIAKIGNLRCLDLLVKQFRANVDVQCKNGCTPLHIAVAHSQRLFVRSLVQIYHARTDIMDYAGRFPRTLLSEDMKEDLEDLLTSGRLAEMRKQFEIQEHPPANHRKSSFSNKKPLLSAAEDTLSKISSKSGPAKVHPDDCHARLLLSTLSRDQEYVSTLVRRLRHGTVVPPSPPSGGSSTTRKSACQKSLTLKRSSVFGGRGGCGTDSERKSSVFKIPHLPNPSRQLSSASLSVGTLLRRGKGHLMGRRRAKSKTASLLVGATERHSFAGLEQLASRLGSVNGVSRQPSNVSDGVTKSSSDDFGIFDSASSSTSLGRQRTSSLSSLVACTEDLFSQYFSSVSPPNQD